jgi:hypothetical protein
VLTPRLAWQLGYVMPAVHRSSSVPAHRGRPRERRPLRRAFTAGVLALTSGVGFLAAAGPAHAATTWNVATTGTDSATCGNPAPCRTLQFLLNRGTTSVASGDTINVAAGTYTDHPAFNSNRAVTVNGVGTVTYNGGAAGSVFTVNVGVTNTLTLNNLTLTNGKATTATTGGALTISTGKVVATGVNLTASTASTSGGGAYVGAASGNSLSMTNGTVASNTAPNGAGIMTIGAPVTLDGTTVTGNTATGNGGGIDVSNASASLTMTNGTVGGATAAAKNSAANGGGIYTAGGPLTLNGTTISGNAGAIGGGVYVLAGTSNLTNLTVSGNTASNVGGGIVSAGTTNVSGGSIAGNSAAAQGGGLWNNIGTTTLTNTSMTGNSAPTGGAVYNTGTNGTVNTSGATISSNTASTSGGAIYNAVATSKVNTSGGSISGNTAPNGGAALNAGIMVVDGTALDNNTANGGAAANAGNGGAIYNALTLTVKNATWTGNKAIASSGITGYGGAVFSSNLAANTSPTNTFTDTTINGGAVSGGNAVWGGAIAVYQNVTGSGTPAKITGTGLTLSKNVAAVAGGIYSYGSVSLTGSTLDQNKATDTGGGYGGGLYVAAAAGTSPALVVDDTDVTGNSAAVAGGGGILGAGVTSQIRNGSKVNGNSAPSGAGLYNGSALSVTDSQVNGNAASVNGGGVYTLAPTSLVNTTIDANTAAFLGGGLVGGAAITMTGGEVDGNNAYGAGGALVGDNIAASFDGTDFTDNTSTGANFGGGAILSGGKLTVDHATFSGNKADGASGSGGAIFSGSSNENVTTTLKVSNSTITDNESYVGSAIFAGSSKASSTNKASVTNTTVHANAASGPFGAIETTAPMSVVGSTITDNTAVPTSPFDAYGGIVAGSAGLVSLSGSVLAGNNGHQCNVTVADGGYNLNSPTASECGFSAGQNDVFAAPQLGALADNGGPTRTRLPGPTSPALDRIPAATATGVSDAITGAAITLCGAGASDQRGTSRPQGAKCDIGAVEADQVVPTVDGPANADYAVGSAGTPLVYTTTGSPQPTLAATGLPSGVTFHDNGDGTGTISGTPAAGTGGSYTVTVTATNEAGSGTKTLTLVVHQAPTISGPAAATYTVGQPGGPTTFTQTTGHPLGIFSSIGSLPTGVGFDDSVAGQGTYAGTPAAGTGGVYNLTVKDSNGTPPDATVPFALTVDEAPSLTGPGTATFKVGTASESAEFTATGFPVPTLSATGLPAGLALTSTGTGKVKISGTAANGTGGLYPVTVKAANGVGSDATAAVSVTVNEAPELVGPTEARFVTGFANTIGFSSDGYPQATLTVSGSVPAWLTFTDNGNGSASLSGTAPSSAVGSYPLTITASNGQSPDAVLHVTVVVVPPVSISTASLPHAAFHTAYSAQIMATGGQPAYSFQVISGALPQGLTLSSFGQITGSTTSNPGTYNFTVKVTDSAQPAQTATRALSITVVKGDTTLVVDPVLIQTSGLNIKVGVVSATLTGGFPALGVPGQTIVFKSGTTTLCTGVTDASGRVARCPVDTLKTLQMIAKGSVTGTYAGSTTWNPSSGSAGLIG